MATSSFFNTVVIDTPEKAEKFVDALEKAERYSREHTEPKVDCRWVRDDEVKEFWNDVGWE